MKYEKALGKIVEFNNVDVIATSTNYYDQDQTCAQPSWDAEYCDGVTQAVTKPF